MTTSASIPDLMSTPKEVGPSWLGPAFGSGDYAAPLAHDVPPIPVALASARLAPYVA